MLIIKLYYYYYYYYYYYIIVIIIVNCNVSVVLTGKFLVAQIDLLVLNEQASNTNKQLRRYVEV